MSVNIDLHSDGESKVVIKTRIYDDPKFPTFAVVVIEDGDNTVKFFTHKLSDLETMAFHLGAVIQELRDEYGWTN